MASEEGKEHMDADEGELSNGVESTGDSHMAWMCTYCKATYPELGNNKFPFWHYSHNDCKQQDSDARLILIDIDTGEVLAESQYDAEQEGLIRPQKRPGRPKSSNKNPKGDKAKVVELPEDVGKKPGKRYFIHDVPVEIDETLHVFYSMYCRANPDYTKTFPRWIVDIVSAYFLENAESLGITKMVRKVIGFDDLIADMVAAEGEYNGEE